MAKPTYFRIAFLIFTLAAPSIFAAPPKIGVFIPGVREGSPIYDNLAKGVERYAATVPGTVVRIFEAGFNQAEWEEKLTSFTATGNFDLVITSNPSLPSLINRLAPLFPRQKFINFEIGRASWWGRVLI